MRIRIQLLTAIRDAVETFLSYPMQDEGQEVP